MKGIFQVLSVKYDANCRDYVAEDDLELMIFLFLPPNVGIAGFCHYVQLMQCRGLNLGLSVSWETTAQAELQSQPVFPFTLIYSGMYFVCCVSEVHIVHAEAKAVGFFPP